MRLTVLSDHPSRLQQLMLAGQAIAPASPFYNMAFSFEFNGALDEERFALAVAQAVQASDTMTLCIGRNGALQQISLDPGSDLSLVHEVELTLSEARELAKERARSRIPVGSRLFDTVLFRCGEQHYLWYLNFHHVITDAAAFALFYDQVRCAYLGKPRAIDPFADYLQTERQSLASDATKRAQQYWSNKCDQYNTSEATRPKELVASFTERQSIVLDSSLMELLKVAGSSPGLRSVSEALSVFSILAAALLILRHRLFDSQAQTLGCPFHKRLLETVAGPTIEIGFIGVSLTTTMTFTDLVKAIQLDAFESMRNCFAGTSSSQINNSFSWLLNYLNEEYGDLGEVRSESSWLHSGQGDAAHELRLQVHDFDASGHLNLHFDMQTAVFTSQQRQRIPKLFVRLLEQCLAQPDLSISSYSLLSKTRDSESAVSNHLGFSAPCAKQQSSVLEMLAIYTQQTPDSIAVTDGETQLSFIELDDAANSVASGLSNLPIAPLFLPRSIDAIVVILAAMKARVPFVPLDVDHPPKRINDVLTALGSDLLITASGVNCEGIDATALMIDKGRLEYDNHGESVVSRNENDAAYIIFTSGSTGTPKGVSVGNASLNNYLTWAADYYANNDPICMPLFSSLAFDLTLTSILLPLFTGGTVRVYPQTSGSQLDVLNVFKDDLVDFVKLTPSHLNLVLNSVQHGSGKSPRKLNGLILGGENLATVTAQKAQALLGNTVALFNEYGPTEATIGCMIHRFNAGIDKSDSVPIGNAIPGASIELLDYLGQPVPEGFDGALHISGDVLAEGYWQSSPIAGTNYQTGDRGRQVNGVYTYLGRADRQAKFRGARVELAEIENALRSIPSVDEASVQIYRNLDNGNSSLCTECGIHSNVPGIKLANNGRCNVCEKFDAQKDRLQSYFKTIDDLKANLGNPLDQEPPVCLALASGGKDSSYMVCKLVELGYKPIVFTLDNGYLSEHALGNVERMTNRLGLEWIRECPSDMNLIFSDSLARHSNVCDGCFKTIYTLAINYCLSAGISHIVTGLSRGQLFETRLIDMLEADVLNERLIDERVKEARIAYHQIDDAISDCLDVTRTRDKATFDKISFVDFYRYTDVELAEMYQFLESYGDWQRPPDTGRSTNCLINDVGIHVHKTERGHHNYAVPYAWDVRMGHKARAEAVEELNDDIDSVRVQEILEAIDYTPKQSAESEDQLVAYVCLAESSEFENLTADIRQQLRDLLPEYAIPTTVQEIEEMPLNVSGKLDTSALPKPSVFSRRNKKGQHTSPNTDIEKQILTVWQCHFLTEDIGTTDDFFALGGDSIKAVHISADCISLGIELAPTDLFVHASIVELARVARIISPAQSQNSIVSANSGLDEDELSDLLGRMDRRG